MSAIFASSSLSSTSSRPQNWATVATVMSSAVGPRPPLVTMRSTPSSARNRSWASMSCGRSPQIVMCASSTPSSRSCSATHGPLRSVTRPVRTSVPVTTMPARVLTTYDPTHTGRRPCSPVMSFPLTTSTGMKSGIPTPRIPPTYAAGTKGRGSRFVDRPPARSPRAVTARPAAMFRAEFTSALHRPALHTSHSKTAWLLRFPGATCPQAEHRCDVYAADTCSSLPDALCCKRVTS